MPTIETSPLGEEIMLLSAARLEAELWRPDTPYKSLSELVGEHTGIHRYTAESAGELGQDVLAELGGQAIDLYFLNKDAEDSEDQTERARQEAAEMARERLDEIAAMYLGSRLKVTGLTAYSGAIFRQTNIDYLNPRGKEYREAVGKINRRSFALANKIDLTMPGLLKRIDGTSDLSVELFRPYSTKPQVKLELIG